MTETQTNKFIAFMSILSVLLLLASGFLAYQNLQLQKQISQLSVQPSPSPTPFPETPSADPTADWKTYTNAQFNYSFKYPSEADLKELRNDEKKNIVNLTIPNISRPSNNEAIGLFAASLESKTFEQYISEKANPQIIGGFAITKKPKIYKTNKISGYLYEEKSFASNQEYRIIVFPLKYNNYFEIRYPLIKETENATQIFVDQILSTFKFIGEDVEGQFCGGFAGKVCPKGYSCKYDGNYPDAGGKCIKN